MQTSPMQVAASPTKACRACRAEKPLEAFGRRLQTKDGRASRCLACSNAHVRRYKRERSSQTCTKCGERRPASAFSRHRWRPSGLNNCCKACDNNRRSPSVPAELPGHCAGCGRPPEACTFPLSKPQGSATSKRSSWCLDCHLAFRRRLTPQQAEREAQHWLEC